MKLVLHNNFKKQYKKLKALQKKVDSRLILFTKNPFAPVLNNHSLAGKYQGYRSINITGNYRAIYKFIEKNTAYFIALDSHSNLYR